MELQRHLDASFTERSDFDFFSLGELCVFIWKVSFSKISGGSFLEEASAILRPRGSSLLEGTSYLDTSYLYLPTPPKKECQRST